MSEQDDPWFSEPRNHQPVNRIVYTHLSDVEDDIVYLSKLLPSLYPLSASHLSSLVCCAQARPPDLDTGD